MKEQLSETKLHALDYWQVIRNRWGVILLTFFLISLASLVIIALLDRKFDGRTKFQINTSSAPTVYESDRALGGSTFSGNWFETEVKSIMTRETLSRVVKNMNLLSEWGGSEEEALYKLENMVEVEQERGTDIVSVIAWSTKAPEAMEIANAVREAYQARRIEREEERLNRLKLQVEQKIKSQSDEAEVARQKMNDLAKRYGIVDDFGTNPQGMSVVGNPELNVFRGLVENTSKTKTEVLTYQNQLASLLKVEGRDLIQSAMALKVEDATITQQLPKLQEATMDLKRFTALGFGRMHPKIRALTGSIADMEALLKKAVEDYRSALKIKLEQAKQMLTDTTDITEVEKVKTLEARGKQTEYQNEKNNYERNMTLLASMKEHAMKTAVDEGVTRTPIELHEKATVATTPSKPKVTLFLSIGAGLGLLLGVILAFFLEYLDTSVKSLDDVERYLGVPVLAVIPKDVGVLHKQSGLSPDAEAYRILRTNIEFNRRSADANAITIVSGGAGEGKSTTLVNLAYICAQGGYNTLMIDGDLRRPKLHTFFDINNSVGLTNYLTTALMLEDVILQTPIENLYFMPSGILPADAAGILNSRRMSELIADVKNRFDLVLIDSPPILGVSDASVLASEVDLTIIVIQHRKLPRNMLLRVKQALENVGGNLLGVVLNNVDVRSDSQYQYYTSYYTYYSPTNIDPKSKRQAAAAGGNAARPNPAPAAAGGDDDY